jgi:tRNA U34 2-thiouridine synthase MnmA/TrmU
MGYFKDKMRKFIRWAQSDDYANEPNKNGITSLQNSKRANMTIGSNAIEEHNGGLNFTVYSATGGKVVQIRTYNIATDRSTSMLYIISDKEDLGKELGHIITIESLSR